MGCVLSCIPQAYCVPIIAAGAQQLCTRLCPDLYNWCTRNCSPCWTNSNKKIVMLGSRSLKIEHSEKSEIWQWEEDESETRFGEVVIEGALGITHLEIDASINFVRLSPNTDYAAYLIYKTKADSVGLDAPLEATISVGQTRLMNTVCIKPSTSGPARNKRRAGNWMEMDLGHFRVNDDTGKVDISLKETKVWKTGLTIAGIEVRPV